MHDLFILPPLVRLTSAIVSGSLLPTPLAPDADKPRRGLGSLTRGNGGGKLLPTPTAADFDRGNDGKARQGSNSLGHMARAGLLPTPTASEYGSTNNGKRPDGSTYRTAGKPSLSTMARTGLIPTPTVSDASAAGSRNTANSKAHPGACCRRARPRIIATARTIRTARAGTRRSCDTLGPDN